MSVETIVAKLERLSMPEPNSGCWLWLGGVTRAGYGQISVRHNRAAHRVSYETFIGPIPAGLVIDHKCRTRSCINPLHLEPVTPTENTRRGWPVTKTHCKRGHALTEDNLYSHLHGWRQCATCKRAHVARYKAAAKLARTLP